MQGGCEMGSTPNLSLPSPPIPLGIASYSRLSMERESQPTIPPEYLSAGSLGQDSTTDHSERSSWNSEVSSRRTVNAFKQRRPVVNGLPAFDFGPDHVPGMLSSCSNATGAPNLPPKAGTGVFLRPAKLHPASCVPPAAAEPMIDVDSLLPQQLQQHVCARSDNPRPIINQIVYDCLLPSPAHRHAGTVNSTGPHYRHSYAPDLPSWFIPEDEEDTTLVFESRFESGNLRRAVQVYPNEYDLILRPDINTRGHTQWFYFSVANTRAGTSYTFNIINLAKDDSLYNDGMQPLLHSACRMAGEGVGWHRGGERVAYFTNTIRRTRRKRYHTLSFSLTAAYDNDTLHIAHCYPYTYTDLQHALHDLEQHPVKRQWVSREVLCTTLAGNAVDLLTITSPLAVLGGEVPRRRKAVMLSARVHPGETNASWMMKGVLDFLTGPSAEAQQLRDNFVFKVVPMLNPDGVINGNYRCSLAGIDLNRVWDDPSSKLHPVVSAMKHLMRRTLEEREVALFCDLHGHSRKLDVFLYGCEKKPKDGAPVFPSWPVPGSVGGVPNFPVRFQERLLPLLLHHALPDVFNYRHCNFKVQKGKAGTGRVVGFREFGLVNSFTLEASFCGASTGRWARQHFSTAHLESMGAALVVSLLDYWDPDSYGFAELLGELELMHPANGDARRYSVTADGQLVEDEDVPCTDSDDETSDEEALARRAARRRRAAEAALEPRQGRHSAGATPGCPSSAVTHALQATTSSDSEVMDAKKVRRKQLKQLLKAEAAKASEGLAACLPLLGSGVGANGYPHNGRGSSIHANPHPATVSSGEGSSTGTAGSTIFNGIVQSVSASPAGPGRAEGGGGGGGTTLGSRTAAAEQADWHRNLGMAADGSSGCATLTMDHHRLAASNRPGAHMDDNSAAQHPQSLAFHAHSASTKLATSNQRHPTSHGIAGAVHSIPLDLAALSGRGPSSFTGRHGRLGSHGDLTADGQGHVVTSLEGPAGQGHGAHTAGPGHIGHAHIGHGHGHGHGHGPLGPASPRAAWLGNGGGGVGLGSGAATAPTALQDASSPGITGAGGPAAGVSGLGGVQLMLGLPHAAVPSPGSVGYREAVAAAGPKVHVLTEEQRMMEMLTTNSLFRSF